MFEAPGQPGCYQLEILAAAGIWGGIVCFLLQERCKICCNSLASQINAMRNVKATGPRTFKSHEIKQHPHIPHIRPHDSLNLLSRAQVQLHRPSFFFLIRDIHSQVNESLMALLLGFMTPDVEQFRTNKHAEVAALFCRSKKCGKRGLVC